MGVGWVATRACRRDARLCRGRRCPFCDSSFLVPAVPPLPVPPQVLTTFQNAANLHTLSAIYWWRIVVDEPQLNAGKFLGDHNHDW